MRVIMLLVSLTQARRCLALKKKKHSVRAGGVLRRKSGVKGIKRRNAKRVVKTVAKRLPRGKSRVGKGKLRTRKSQIRRRKVTRRSTSKGASYHAGFNESYNTGYNAGFTKGFEDGHQLAYEQQI